MISYGFYMISYGFGICQLDRIWQVVEHFFIFFGFYIYNYQKAIQKIMKNCIQMRPVKVPPPPWMGTPPPPVVVVAPGPRLPIGGREAGGGRRTWNLEPGPCMFMKLEPKRNLN